LNLLQSRFEVANISGVGRGLVSRRNFASGELLLAVPKELLITPQTAQASELGRMFKMERIPDCRSGTLEVSLLFISILMRSFLSAGNSAGMHKSCGPPPDTGG
jgi:hypothetical protein